MLKQSSSNLIMQVGLAENRCDKAGNISWERFSGYLHF